MNQGDSDDFLERPVLTFSLATEEPYVFAAGDQVANRFRVVGSIGRGGMGEVYEAEDLELGARVALKTVLPELATEPAAVERFRTEVLRARSVSHPNVCRVYDVFTHESPTGTVRFLTMELIAGETLAARLAREGAIPLGPAEDLIGQMAAALDAAHARGVVHRDFKPSNIMLSGSQNQPRVVVTDFGIAHELTANAALQSGNERYVGTVDYMSPELRTAGQVSPAVDAYAFGIVVHELLTGSFPDPALAALPESHLPRRWVRLIRRCLDPVPSKRPTALVDAVRDATGIFAGRRAKSALTITAALALLTLALIEPFSRFLRWAPTLTANPAVVIAEIDNATPEPVLDSASELLARQLEQSPSMTVIDPGRVRQVLQTMALPVDSAVTAARAREIVWRTGAAAFVSGSIRRTGGAYALAVRLEARAEQPDVVGPNWSRGYEARDRNELLIRIRDAANWVRSAAGEAGTEIPKYDRPVADVTTSSWQALHLYSRAESLLAQSRQDDALALLAEATREDPDFALAWMRMGDVFMSRRQLDQGYTQWERALAVMRRRNLGTREEYRIRGMYASDTHDFAEAERVYRLYLLSYPNDFRPFFYIARPLLMLGRTDEAITMLERARDLNPSEPSIPAQLAMFKIRRGRLNDVAIDLATLRRLGQDALATCIESQVAFLHGDVNRAMRGFRSLNQAKEPALRRRAAGLQAAVLADLGRTQEAAEILRRGAETDASTGDVEARADKLLTRAELELRLDHGKTARDLGILAEQLDRSALRTAAVGQLYARAGALDDAARALAALPSDSPSRQLKAMTLRLQAEIALAKRDVVGAWARFQQAAALEGPGVAPEYLARGALAAGELGTAMALYSSRAADPGYYWRYPDNDPGRWFEALSEYLLVARRASVPPDPGLADRYRRLTTSMLNSENTSQLKER